MLEVITGRGHLEVAQLNYEKEEWHTDGTIEALADGKAGDWEPAAITALASASKKLLEYRAHKRSTVREILPAMEAACRPILDAASPQSTGNDRPSGADSAPILAPSELFTSACAQQVATTFTSARPLAATQEEGGGGAGEEGGDDVEALGLDGVQQAAGAGRAAFDSTVAREARKNPQSLVGQKVAVDVGVGPGGQTRTQEGVVIGVKTALGRSTKHTIRFEDGREENIALRKSKDQTAGSRFCLLDGKKDT
jgi:hypothetical protein